MRGWRAFDGIPGSTCQYKLSYKFALCLEHFLLVGINLRSILPVFSCVCVCVFVVGDDAWLFSALHKMQEGALKCPICAIGDQSEGGSYNGSQSEAWSCGSSDIVEVHCVGSQQPVSVPFLASLISFIHSAVLISVLTLQNPL